MDALNELLQYCNDAIGYGDYALHAPKVKALSEVTKNEIDKFYIKMPVDINGTPIHVGDTLTHLDNPNKPFKVSIIVYDGYAWWIESSYGVEYMANKCQIFPYSIEDMLTLFLTACGDDDPHYYDDEIHEYANKLRAMCIQDGTKVVR